MASPRYNLKWDSHQRHLAAVFETLLNTETLVDVTLVCKDGVMMRAHKLILSANSPYFAKIFSETPGKHPTVVLSHLSDWELQALIDFMYRGQVSVCEDQLSALMKVAEELMIEGLTTCGREQLQLPRLSDERSAPDQNHEDPYFTPSPLPSSPEPPDDGDQYWSDDMMAPSNLKISRMDVIDEKDSELLNIRRRQGSPTPSDCGHAPRRKQARPQKRREDMPSLLPANMPPNNSSDLPQQPIPLKTEQESHDDSNDGNSSSAEDHRDPDEPADLTAMWQHSEVPSHCSSTDFKTENGHMSFSNGRPNSYPPLTPPSTLPPPTPPRTSMSHKMPGPSGSMPMFSAPRGGPPRHWSNENLTEALRNVWSGRMKTAQASRVFGIPYNSLLMYVRGKYGKSLKLDLIKKGEIPTHLASEPFNVRTPSLSPFLGPRLQRPGNASTPPGLKLPHATAIANAPIPLSQLTLMLEDMRGNRKVAEESTANSSKNPMHPLPPFFPHDPTLRSLSMLNNLLAVPPGTFGASLNSGSLSERFRQRSLSTDPAMVGTVDD